MAVEDCHLLSSSSSLSLLALTWVICRDSWLPLRIVILSRNLTCGSVGMSSGSGSGRGSGYLEGDKEGDRLHAVVAAVHVVSHEEVVGVGGLSW